MTHALPAPAAGGLLTQWSPQPVAIVLVVALAGWYVVAVRRLSLGGRRWPVARSVTFASGLLLLTWTANGFLQVYAPSLYWAWTTQMLVLLLAVPLVLLSGGPLQLAGLGSRAATVDRFVRSAPLRALSNPLVGPALIPLLSAVLFFGPVPGWAISVAPVGWLLQLLLIVVGGAVVLPLVGLSDERSSLAVGLSLAIGSIELVLDAIPGLVLRLHTHLATSYFDHRAVHDWTPAALHDQQVAGAVLWVVAEVIDLPFLVLVYRRWLRVDAHEAATVDAVLEAERIARGGLREDGSSVDSEELDAPWWLNDPAMRRRLGHPD